MAIDPRKLRPSDLCRLLNSTPLGEVISERQLYRHRTRAGFRIEFERRLPMTNILPSWDYAVKRRAPRSSFEPERSRFLSDGCVY